MIYGLGLLALAYLLGQGLGELLGLMIGVEANVGGVGFAMLILVSLHHYAQKKGWAQDPFDEGIRFWSQLYIPVIVAMSATQDAVLALSHGLLPLLAGAGIIALAFLIIPLLTKTFPSMS